MCKHQIKKGNEIRECKYPGTPYCKKHKANHIEFAECNVCNDEKEIFQTGCCSFKICQECLIKSARKTCCQCNKNLKLDKTTLSIIKFIKQKDRQILDLQNQVQNLETIQRMRNQVMNTSQIFREILLQ